MRHINYEIIHTMLSDSTSYEILEKRKGIHTILKDGKELSPIFEDIFTLSV
jgi:hypothetical protein